MEETLHIAPLPSKPNDIALYVTHLSSTLKTATIRSHLSAVAFFHQLHGYANPTSSFLIKKLLASRKKREACPPTRKAITINILRRLISTLKLPKYSSYERKLYTAVFNIMYHAALRASEVCITPSSAHTLKASQLKTVPCRKGEALKIHFASYKHSPRAPKPLILYPTQSSTCAVGAYNLYIRPQTKRDGPAFLVDRRRPLTRQLLASTLHDLLRHMHLNPSNYNTHSFRIGKATDMANQGYSYSQIALLGRWHSNAFLKYIKPTVVHGTR